MKGEKGLRALAIREIPRQRSLEICSSEQEWGGGEQLTSCCREELPEKIQIFFTICLKYYLEHTYMKNYSSFAENSNLMGTPGFLLAVFGNCVPRPHGSQTLEGEKATNPLHV